MSEANLMGWDDTNKKWRKLICNDEGKLIIDPTEIFEDTPTDNEHGKAPTSNWGYDHENNPSAHHEKYTDAEAVAALETVDKYLKNDGDTCMGDYDFNEHVLFIDASEHKVGINTVSPLTALYVVGQIQASKGIKPALIINGSSVTNGTIYSSLSGKIPSIGNSMIIFGQIYYSSHLYHVNYIFRNTSTSIVMYTMRDDGTRGYLPLESGGTLTFTEVIITC